MATVDSVIESIEQRHADDPTLLAEFEVYYQARLVKTLRFIEQNEIALDRLEESAYDSIVHWLGG